MSTPAYVCAEAVAEEAAVLQGDASLIAMAEVPRTVGGTVFTPPSVLVITVNLLLFFLMSFK